MDGKLEDIGQKLHDLLETNTDILPDLREKIIALVMEYPQVRKKFEALGGKLKQD